MKYIFVAGAPGSKWSSVAKNIYYSDSIDRSDYRDDRTYYHDASGQMELMHLGAYFDPEMEFDLPADLSTLSKSELDAVFDSAFNGVGVRIIKSHIFAHNIDFLKDNWPECPIVLVHRDNDSCIGWWVRCGHFGITYPDYAGYYKDLRNMSVQIDKQNADIIRAWAMYTGVEPGTNRKLAAQLGIEAPPLTYAQDYSTNNLMVKVI